MKNSTEWIKALRSGKYRQGKGRLDYEGKFCCLGVACCVAPVASRSFNGQLAGGDLSLQPIVREYFGFTSANPQIPSLDVSLVGLNDTYRLTFDQIATIISIYADEIE